MVKIRKKEKSYSWIVFPIGIIMIIFAQPILPEELRFHNMLEKTFLGKPSDHDVQNVCLNMNGTYDNHKCIIGDKLSTLYSFGISCNDYVIVIHHNDTVDISLPKKVEDKCIIIKEERLVRKVIPNDEKE